MGQPTVTVTANSTSLNWSTLLEANKNYVSFTLFTQRQNSPSSACWTGNQTNATVGSLEPNAQYTFRLEATFTQTIMVSQTQQVWPQGHGGRGHHRHHHHRQPITQTIQVPQTSSSTSTLFQVDVKTRRIIPTEPIEFTPKTVDHERNLIREFKPEFSLPSVNILIVGQSGSGKSALINGFITAMRNDGQICRIAEVRKSSEHVTHHYNCFDMVRLKLG